MLGTPPQSETDVKPQAAREPLGRVISVTGSQARIGLTGVRNMGAESRVTVGKFLGVRCGRSLLIGMITEVFAQAPAAVRDLDR